MTYIVENAEMATGRFSISRSREGERSNDADERSEQIKFLKNKMRTMHILFILLHFPENLFWVLLVFFDCHKSCPSLL